MASCTYYIGRTYILSFVDKFKPLWMCQEKVLSCFSCCFHEIKFCFLTFWMVAFSDLEAEQEEPHEGCEAQTSQREAVGSLVSAVPAALKPFESIGWLDNPGHVGILEKHFGTRHNVWRRLADQAPPAPGTSSCIWATTSVVYSGFFRRSRRLTC